MFLYEIVYFRFFCYLFDIRKKSKENFMKKYFFAASAALTALACLTACDDSSSGASNSIPTYKTESALPDTCEMEVAKAGDAYFACFENKWI